MFNNRLKGGIIYQIMPDRFYSYKNEITDQKEKIIHLNWNEEPIFKPDKDGIIKNNDFFCGNLKGVIEKLQYLNLLGVNFIYLNPIFKAYSNHRYDTGDYMQIDPLLGTEEDFKELCNKAKEYNIGIILDGVFAHTGSDSRYFNRSNNYEEVGAYNSKESKYINWYKFTNYPNNYNSWWGFDTLPQTNQNCTEFRQFICNTVIPKWMDLGVCGFRLDVVDEISSLFLDEISKAIHDRNGFVIGEVWENAAKKCAYGEFKDYFNGNRLDSVMNYIGKDAIIDYVRYGTDYFKNEINEIINTYPKEALNNLMNILSTHDIERAITAISMPHLDGRDRNFQYLNHQIPKEKYETAKKLFKLAVVLQYFIPGVPCIYYGDEIGMSGYKDPFNRYPFDWEKKDELTDFFKVLGKIRKENKFLSDANFEILHYDQNYITFKRELLNEKIIVCVNRSKYYIVEDKINKDNLIFTNSNIHNNTVEPYSFVIFKSC